MFFYKVPTQLSAWSEIKSLLLYSRFSIISSIISFSFTKIHKKTKTNTEYLIKIHMVLTSSEMQLNL